MANTPTGDGIRGVKGPWWRCHLRAEATSPLVSCGGDKPAAKRNGLRVAMESPYPQGPLRQDEPPPGLPAGRVARPGQLI